MKDELPLNFIQAQHLVEVLSIRARLFAGPWGQILNIVICRRGAQVPSP